MTFILTYHAVEAGAPPLFTTPHRFAAQMGALRASGFTGVTIGALAALLRAGDSVPDRTVALTFDDGYQSVLTEALPILQAHAFVATVFVISDQRDNAWPGQPAAVPQRPLLDAEGVAALVGAGWEIGAHTRTHPTLTALPADAAEAEIIGCKEAIQRQYGVTPLTFCYPYGVLDRAVRSQVAQHYHAAVGTRMAPVRPDSDLFDLPRLDSYYVTPDLLSRLDSLSTRWYVQGRAVLRAVKRLAPPDGARAERIR